MYGEASGRVFARKSDHVNSIIRARAPRVVEEEMFGIENLCWNSVSDVLLEKGKIKAGEIWNIYKTAPRIPQKPMRPEEGEFTVYLVPGESHSLLKT
ncbi:hypothetical protein Bca4012_059214 [Brassica carinata]